MIMIMITRMMIAMIIIWVVGWNHYHDDEDHHNHDFRRTREVLLELDPRAKPSTD